MELNEIVTRLRVLEDEREITRTMYRYAHAQYNGNKAVFLDCFAEDAVIVRSRHGREVVGKAEIDAYFDTITHAPEAYHKHVLVEPLVEVDGDTATASSDFLYVQDGKAGPLISHFGHYADKLARGADGSWRFTRRELQTEAVNPGPVSTVRGDPGRVIDTSKR